MDSSQVLDEIKAQGAAYTAARAAVEVERARLIELVKKAVDAEVKQADIVRASGWTREYVARIGRGEVK